MACQAEERDDCCANMNEAETSHYENLDNLMIDGESRRQSAIPLNRQDSFRTRSE